MNSIDSSLSRIRRLPQELANQVAAGEIIERPASVIKELVENSLDAASSSIEIDIEDGGKGLIRVHDNGHGIYGEDLPLALECHATSKLYTLDQLFSITKLGFRGEALSSIASVASITIQSFHQAADRGYQICKKPGYPVEGPSVIAHPIGTTVVVNNLFFNMPPRHRQLRGARSEVQRITRLIRAFAIGWPEVSFCLRQQGRKILHFVSQNSIADRLRKVIGRDFEENAIYCKERQGDLMIEGWIAPPEQHFSHMDRQYSFFNRRVIHNRDVQHAIRLAYQSFNIDARKLPHVICLTAPFDTVDVNIHPCKEEVYFCETGRVHALIYYTLKNCLGQLFPISSDKQKSTTRVSPRVVESESDSTTYSDVSSYTHVEWGRVVGSIKGKYLILLNRYHLNIADVHAIRSAFTQFQMKRRLRTFALYEQRPLSVALLYSIADVDVPIDKLLPYFAHIGFRMDIVRPYELYMKTIPVFLAYTSLVALLDDLFAYCLGDTQLRLDFLEAVPSPDKLNKYWEDDKLLNIVAQHVNDGAPSTLSDQECIEVLDQLSVLTSEQTLEKCYQDRLLFQCHYDELDTLLQRSFV